MRAVCENCHAAQPPDWQSGDLCVQCGQVVRREKRCHWCTRLSPDGKFCRHCGSNLVPDVQYGAARMLKSVGVDQFSLIERLEKMDPGQLEHFSRLYAPHERMLERHVDDLSFVEGFLRGSGWSGALEEDWLGRLPLGEDSLRALTLPPTRAVTDFERLEEIRDGSPFELSRQLASLARIRLGAPRGTPDADLARAAFASSDPQVHREAALTLAHWRFAYLGDYGPRPTDLRDALYTLYRNTPPQDPCSSQAALGLALLAKQYANVQSVEIPSELLEPLLGDEDPDLAFGAALALEHLETLIPVLKTPINSPLAEEKRSAAALAVARAGQAGPLASMLLDLPEHTQQRVLETLRYRVGASPELHGALLGLLENPLLPDWSPLRSAAAELLALENRPEDALRLLRINLRFADTVLQNPTLSAQDLEKLCAFLLEKGEFNLYRYASLSALASEGRVPDDFVPRYFLQADDYGRQELCSFAQVQLEARRDPTLHHFLWSVVASDLPQQTRERAWAALSGWYSYTRPGEEPLKLTLESVRHYFTSVQSFLERLCDLLEKPDILRDLYRYDDFLNLLQEVDQDLLPALLERSALLQRLRRGLWSLAHDTRAYSRNRSAAVGLLGRLARSRAERKVFGDALRGLLKEDPPWDLRRSSLEALNLEERQTFECELKARLETDLDYEQRERSRALLDDLEYVAQGQD